MSQAVNREDDALDFCFKKMLTSIANIDIARRFGLANHPCSFVVYAHENDSAGKANSQYVQNIIEWLKEIRAPNISDSSPFLLWESENDPRCADDILSSQMRLLPAYEGPDAVEKIILCVSQVLRKYSEDEFAANYIAQTLNLYETHKQSMKRFEKQMRAFMKAQLKLDRFHHVLTEIAFIQIRLRHHDETSDGIIPITLDGGDLGIESLASLGVYLKLLTPDQTHQHRLFFRLLQRLYPSRHRDFDLCQKCYEDLRQWCEEGGNGMSVEVKANKEISRLLDNLITLAESGVRNGDWKAQPHFIDKEHATKHATEQTAVIHKLNAPDMMIEIDKLEDRKDKLLEDCYQWILTTKEYQDFMDWNCGNVRRLLWIKGDPGKGKTMLLLGIVRQLKLHLGSHPENGSLSYFFCQGTNERLNTPTSILRGLIRMLLSQEKALSRHLDRLKTDNLDQEDNAFYILKNILLAMLADESLCRIYLVVDALDECESKSKPGLYELLELISSVSENNERVKWLVSSRNIPDIEDRLEVGRKRARLSLELNENSVGNAVTAYINHKMLTFGKTLENRYQRWNQGSLPHGLQNVIDLATTEIRNKAAGTFLWVALVFRQIQECSGEDLLERVREMPSGLNDMYTRMMVNVNKLKDPERQKRILRIVANAYRPLRLCELVALAQLGELALHEKVVRDCGVLTVSEEKKVVHFVHQSAKDYLTANPDLGSLHSETLLETFPRGLAEGHYNILSCSLNAMSSTLRRDMYDLKHPGLLITQATHPGPSLIAPIRYSCSYWINHLEKVKEYHDTNAILYDDRGLLRNSILFDNDYLSDDGPVFKFLQAHLLHWFEALSILGSVDRGILGLYSLQQMTQTLPRGSSLNHANFVHDAIRVFRQCRPAVEQAPLQVYLSALIFSPEESVVRQTFKREALEWVSSFPKLSTNWNPCLQTLEDHKDKVRLLAFSPNGHQLASGSDGQIVRLWDASTGKCLQLLKGHRGRITSIAFSPDGHQLASGSEDRTVRIWDTGTGKCLNTLRGHASKGLTAAFLPDGQLLASASGDTVRLWNVDSGKCLRVLTSIRRFRCPMQLSSNGLRLAIAFDDGTIQLWNTTTGQSFQILEGPEDSYQVAFSLDGQHLVSGSRDRTIWLWETQTQTFLRPFKCLTERWNFHALSLNGQYLASGFHDGIIHIWNINTGTCLQTLYGPGSILSVVFSPSGQQLASASDNGTIQLWDINAKYLQTLESPKQCITSVVSSRSGQYLAFGGDGIIHLWDINARRIDTLGNFEKSSTGTLLTPVGVSEDGEYLASYGYSAAKLWNINTGKCLVTLCPRGNSTSVAFSLNTPHVAFGCRNGAIELWNTGTQTHFETLRGHRRPVNSVAFSSDGRLISGSYDGEVRIWDIRTRKSRKCKGHTACVNGVILSPDEQQLASCSDDGTIRLWDVNSGDCLQTHKIYTQNICFSPDGSHLITDLGALDVTQTFQSGQTKCMGCGIERNNTWVTWDGENLVWIPPECRPRACAPMGNTIGISCGSGTFYILEIRADILGHKKEIRQGADD